MFEESASAIPSSSIWASMNSWFTPTVLFVLLNVMIGTIALTSSLQKQHQNQNQQQQTHTENDSHQQPKIARSPSVLQRLKSINFYPLHRSQEPQISTQKPPNSQEPLFNQAQNTETHYFFQQNPQENFTETTSTTQSQQSHYIFEQTHQETQTHFDFERTHDEKIDFDEEKIEEMQSMDEVYSQLSGGSHFMRTKSDTEPASGKIPAKLPTKMKKSASSKSAFGHFEERDIVEARRPETVRERGNAKIAEDDEEVDAKADDFINKFKQQLKLQRLDSIVRYKDMIGRGSGGK